MGCGLVSIRHACWDDLPGITRIYNDAIATTVATFDTSPKTDEEQTAWFAGHGRRHPVLVAERNGVVIGWGSLSAWSDRCAYSDAAEASLYVDARWQGLGVGSQLLNALIAEGRKTGLHTIIGRIVAGNETSLQLVKSAGFECVGTLKEVGFKFGRLLDVHLVQYIYR